MAVKSIIEVDVQDRSWQEFQASFEKYQNALKDSPKAWSDVGKKVEATGVSFETLVAALLAQSELTHRTAGEAEAITRATEQQSAALKGVAAESNRVATAQERVEQAAGRTSKHWVTMGHTTKAVAGHVEKATLNILRWSAVGSGLLGVGGLLGLDKMANAAGEGRRSALGLGTTFGEQRAFGLDFGRVVNPDQFLAGVNTALNDPGQRFALHAAGLGESDIQGKDTAQVAAALIPKIKSLADNTSDAMMASVLHARGLDKFIGLQDFERIKRTPQAELQGYSTAFGRDTGALGLGAGQLKAWQDFQVQLKRAGESIETTFIRGLTPLTKPLAELSAGFSDVVKALLSAPQMKEWIHDLSDGLHEFAGFIGTPAFKSDVEGFVADVGKLASAIGGALHAITSSPFFDSTASAKDRAETVKPKGEPGWALTWHGWVWRNGDGSIGAPPDAAPKSPVHKSAFMSGLGFAPHANDAVYRPAVPGGFGSIERSNGLPSGLLNAVYQAESGGGRNLVSPAGALGPFQFMPATARAYGLRDPFDLGASSNAAGHYLSDLRAAFGGDTAKALAAYNWGPGNLRRDIARYGDDWRAHLPTETRRYVERITHSIGSAPQAPARSPHTTVVRIENNTGGNAVVTTSQLAV